MTDLEVAALLVDIAKRNLPPHVSDAQQRRAYLAVKGAASEVERLRSGIEDYLLWEPGRRGHAEAHRRLAALLHPDEGQT